MRTASTKYFDYGQDEIDYLASADPLLGAAMIRIGKLERIIHSDLFEALVHAIVGQLISAKAVNTIWAKMQNRLGEMTPPNLVQYSADEIQSCGITMKKAVCIRHIAESIVDGTFRLDELQNMNDQEVIRQLTALNGVGQWTTEMLLIHALERRDVVSWGDIAIRRGMMKLYGLQTITKEQFEHYRKRYSPLGSIASIYLWEISSE
ncbi:DNA-3-methyladenine glycosylase family protein [Cohnella mopanensis]|uniref:DNA-3-methyladenine glycosylase family protein n=1 Tax=Cohnella mopanensis TaxID=2911966 RepID=UPI001EF79EAC|nr:DNA-3-methyladenine glycosylase 2 family protein [Cohnella mopanensis]